MRYLISSQAMRWPPSLSLLLLCPLALAAGPFNGRDGDAGGGALSPDARGDEAPDRSFDVERLHLRVELKPEQGALEGAATYTLRRLSPGPLVLDQVELEFREVLLDGASVAWRLDGDAILIEIPGPRGQRSTVELRYAATPRTGLHHRGLASRRGDGADTFAHVFSQGEDAENRYWFPAWDHPNDRFAYTGEVAAPPGWRAMTNPTDDLVSYLVMLAAGEFEERGSGAITAWVPPGTSDEAVGRVLDPVPAMMAHLAERTGVPYPWGNYRQIFVERFIYLGMENTGATIEDSRMLIPDRAAGTGAWIESTVAHELAHQWYGDLLTCRSWRELWLNEGFATFMANDWMARSRGPDHAAAAMRSFFEASLDGPAMAGRFHQGPDAPENGRVYVKGASVLHMLRVMLGEEVFWAGIRRYTTEHQRDLVDTDDLRDALERESGQELGWFFQQWVELTHVPDLTVRSRWQEGQASLTVRQATGPGKPAYTLPITVEFGTPAGPVRRTGWLDDEELTLSAPLDAAPLYVAFDPDKGLLARVDQEQAPSAWAAQLQSPSPHARLAAAHALGETDESAALISLLQDGSRPLVLREAAAHALGEQRVTEPLIRAVAAPEDELRMAVAGALGKGTGPDVVKALRGQLQREQNPDVQEGQLRALASVDPRAAILEARALLRARGRESEGLRHAASDVLGQHGERRDLDLLLAPNLPFILRFAPLRSAAHLAAGLLEDRELEEARARIARAAEPLLDDPDLRTRQNVIPLLGEVGDEQTAAKLERYRREEEDRDLVAAAKDASARIQARQGTPPSPSEKEERLDALEERVRQLEDEMDAWREKH